MPALAFLSAVYFGLGISICCDTGSRSPVYYRAGTSLSSAVTSSASLDDTTSRRNETRTPARATYQTLYTMGEGERLRFQYDFDELVICENASFSVTPSTTTPAPTHAVVLIHPIGVGIGRWYYERLMESLANDCSRPRTDKLDRIVFLAPDLLGSGSASAPIAADGTDMMKLPLLTVSDWSDQLQDLMAAYEARSKSKGNPIAQWMVVANGGCSPIALDLARNSVDGTAPFGSKINNVVLSSPPRLPFFLGSVDQEKVEKSYKTLSGFAGRLFWWYALRKNGRFIQRFSEKNLVGRAESLGDEWTKNCVATAKLNNGRSRYSTFSFLAGSLQEGCKKSLDALKNSHVMISLIRGTDKRRNRARSWFWQRRERRKEANKSEGKEESQEDNEGVEETTIEKYIKENGNGGETEYIGGRISLAHEDALGYAAALRLLL